MAQTTLVDLNAPSANAATVANFLAGLPGAPSAAASSAAALGAGGDFAAFAAALLDPASGCPALLFHSAMSDAEVEGVLAWLSALITTRCGAGCAGLVRALCDAAVASDERAALRLRVMVSLFNLLPGGGATRFQVFERLLAYGMRTSNVGVITSYLTHIDAHMKSWAAGSSESDKKRMHLLAYQALKQAGESQAAQGVLVQYLRAFDGADAASLKAVREHAEAAIVGAVQAPLTAGLAGGVDQAGILGYAAVRQLKGEPLYELLEIFASGSVGKFRAFFAEHAALAQSRGLELKRGLENTRLLSVCALAASERELSYATIAGALEVDEVEVEEWVIKAVTADLIEAQIDQLRRIIVIDRATPRFFGAQHWEDLNVKLRAWRTNVRQLLGVIQDAKRQRSAMSQTRSADASKRAAKVKA